MIEDSTPAVETRAVDLEIEVPVRLAEWIEEHEQEVEVALRLPDEPEADLSA